VLFIPTSESSGGGCPSDYELTVQQIEIANGGTLSLPEHEALGVGNPLPLEGESGAFSWDASVNADVIPTVTSPGTNVACAYLIDDLNNTLAVSPTPLDFTVTDPPGTTTPPGGFGGPAPDDATPSDLTLTVAPTKPPVIAGDNIIDVSGRADSSAGSAYLYVTVNDTRAYDGCAPGSEQDVQITEADKGALLAYAEQVTISEAGVFSAPVALNYKSSASGTGVICAYLEQELSDVAVGYERFTIKAHTKASSKHHKKKKHKKKKKKHKKKK
jgi:hypothetical protein